MAAQDYRKELKQKGPCHYKLPLSIHCNSHSPLPMLPVCRDLLPVLDKNHKITNGPTKHLSTETPNYRNSFANKLYASIKRLYCFNFPDNSPELSIAFVQN
jgi:hypothetical protein